MKNRLWSAQTESGVVAHFVSVRSLEKATPGVQPTGEASAIAILSEVVERKKRYSPKRWLNCLATASPKWVKPRLIFFTSGECARSVYSWPMFLTSLVLAS
jgi:hypothetical protein